MIDSKKILAITLARGGSKSIRKKNIALINKKPLIAYTINAAKNSKYIDDYIVSTDDNEIANCSIKLGAKVPFMRPNYLAKDDSTSAEAIIHAVLKFEKIVGYEYDYIVELMCTNPFKNGEMIDKIIKNLHEDDKADAVITVDRLLDHHPARIKKIENGYMKDFCVPEKSESRRQDLLPYAYIRNGNVYAMKRKLIIEEGLRYNSKSCKAYYNPDLISINIDEEKDFILAEYFLKKENK